MMYIGSSCNRNKVCIEKVAPFCKKKYPGETINAAVQGPPTGRRHEILYEETQRYFPRIFYNIHEKNTFLFSQKSIKLFFCIDKCTLI